MIVEERIGSFGSLVEEKRVCIGERSFFGIKLKMGYFYYLWFDLLKCLFFEEIIFSRRFWIVFTGFYCGFMFYFVLGIVYRWEVF